MNEKTTFQILAYVKNVLEEKVVNAVGEKQLLIDQRQLPTLFALIQNGLDACQVPVMRIFEEVRTSRTTTKKRK